MVIVSLHYFQPVPQYHKLMRTWTYKTYPLAWLAQSERQVADKGLENFLSFTLAVVRLVITTMLK